MTLATWQQNELAGWIEDELLARSYDSERPCLVGYGPTEFSTSLALEPYPSIIWDTNRYYADLGVSPRASRVEIRRRYQELGGPNNVRLTAIVKTLFNPQERLRYDLTPLGSFFIDEEMREAARALLLQQDAQLSSLDTREGFHRSINDEVEMVLELERVEQENILRMTARHGYWSYYVWGVTGINPFFAQWRATLAKEVSELMKNPPRLAMGIWGEGGICVKMVGRRMVVFVGIQEEPTDVLSSKAATLIRDMVAQLS